VPLSTISGEEELSDEELEFYSRQIVFRDIGYTGQLKLTQARVCVVGLGGLGWLSATQLTAMGIGSLRLVDRDVVERSNLHRQYLYDVNSLGYPKVEIAAKKLKALNPTVEITPMALSFNMDNALDIIKGVDVVIDGLDSMEPRYAINRACIKLKIPYAFGAAIESFGNVSTIIPGETPCLECLYSNIRDEDLPTCAVVGVLPPVLSIVSSLQVSEAIKIIMGKKPSLAGKLLFVDLQDISFDQITLLRREDCPVCGEKPSGSPLHLERKFIEEVCGRGGKRTFIINPSEDLRLDMKDLNDLLMKRRFQIKVKAKLGITFNYNQRITASTLRSGVTIIEGAKDKDEATAIFKDVISDGLSVSWSRIE